MAFGLSKHNVSPIAIDFGADSLKLMQVAPGGAGRGRGGGAGGGRVGGLVGGRPRLIAAAAAVMPESARCDPNERFAFYTHALKRLLKSQKFRGRRVICSVPAFQALVHHLQVPRGDATDSEAVNELVGLQLRQRLNIDPSRVVIRCFDVGPVVRDGVPKQEVLCIAVGQEVVMRYLAIARAAKLDVVGMHSEQHAILRAFDRLHASSGASGGAEESGREGKAMCYIDLGGATTKVIISHGVGMGPAFAKTIHTGGDHLTRHHAKAAGLTFADARSARITLAMGDSACADQEAKEAEGLAVAMTASANASSLSMAERAASKGEGSAQGAAFGVAFAGGMGMGTTASTEPDPTAGIMPGAMPGKPQSANATTTDTSAAATSANAAAASVNTTATSTSALATETPGMLGPTPEEARVTARPDLTPAHDADETIDCLIDELRMSMRYHQSIFPDRKIDRLVFLGGESRHTETCQKIARALRIGAQLGDPLARLHGASNRCKATGIDFTVPQPGWAVPIGLCLSDANL